MANMLDFKIRRGLSSELFQSGRVNTNVVLELGCWYLCTDTAELFLCTSAEERILRRINDTSEKVTVADVSLCSDGNLVLKYSNGNTTTLNLNKIITDLIKDADYATTSFVKAEVARAQLSGADVDLSIYATKEYVTELLSENVITVLDGGDI